MLSVVIHDLSSLFLSSLSSSGRSNTIMLLKGCSWYGHCDSCITTLSPLSSSIILISDVTVTFHLNHVILSLVILVICHPWHDSVASSPERKSKTNAEATRSCRVKYSGTCKYFQKKFITCICDVKRGSSRKRMVILCQKVLSSWTNSLLTPSKLQKV